MDALCNKQIESFVGGCGSVFVLALTRNGDVYSWGYNGNGELGRGDNVNPTYIPAKVTSLDGIKVVQIACGSNHCVALSDEGKVCTLFRI